MHIQYIIDVINKEIRIFENKEHAKIENDAAYQKCFRSSVLFWILTDQSRKEIVRTYGYDHQQDENWLAPSIKEQADKYEKHVFQTKRQNLIE